MTEPKSHLQTSYETNEIQALFRRFLSECDSERLSAIWKVQSQIFRQFWKDKILSSTSSLKLPDDTDPIIRLLDVSAKGHKRTDVSVARSGLFQRNWERIFQELKDRKDIQQTMDEIFAETSNTSLVGLIDHLKKENDNYKNGLSGEQGTALNTLLFINNPTEFLAMVSLTHRFRVIKAFNLGNPADFKTYGQQIILSNQAIIDGFREKFGLNVTPRDLTQFLYTPDGGYSTNIRAYWQKSDERETQPPVSHRAPIAPESLPRAYGEPEHKIGGLMKSGDLKNGDSATAAETDSVELDEEFDTQITDGTEPEDTSIERPFNPTLINISTKQMSLDTLLKRMSEGEVDLSPDFQRAEVWGPTARSRLIESLLIRIPLPAFYMDATDEDNWLVVDGLQRLSTLRDFAVKKTMSLRDLEFLTQFDGRNYEDLPRNYQRRIGETQVTVYLIEKGTPPEVKFNIFKRINTGGLPLSAQEIRHALNQGPVTSYLKKLADSPEFKRATFRGVSDKRMTARECVLRFLAFTITSPENYKAADFDAFLSDAMGVLNKMSEQERNVLAERFLRAVKSSHSIFGNAAFRKPRLKHSFPVNKALFEVWTVTMDKQTDEGIALLEISHDKVVQRIHQLMINDSEFLNAVSQGTGDAAKVRLRFERFRSMLEETLQ